MWASLSIHTALNWWTFYTASQLLLFTQHCDATSLLIWKSSWLIKTLLQNLTLNQKHKKWFSFLLRRLCSSSATRLNSLHLCYGWIVTEKDGGRDCRHAKPFLPQISHEIKLYTRITPHRPLPVPTFLTKFWTWTFSSNQN